MYGWRDVWMCELIRYVGEFKNSQSTAIIDVEAWVDVCVCMYVPKFKK